MVTKKKEETDIDIFQSNLVPKHEILNGEEKSELLKQLNVSLKQLPRIKEDDPVMKMLQGKHGDVVRITRKSLVAGEYIHYRVVV
ncbi:MAG: DNA-directed RNA polymerase subunit H [Candidatus Aenigmatarchaeota archaeon]